MVFLFRVSWALAGDAFLCVMYYTRGADMCLALAARMRIAGGADDMGIGAPRAFPRATLWRRRADAGAVADALGARIAARSPARRRRMG